MLGPAYAGKQHSKTLSYCETMHIGTAYHKSITSIVVALQMCRHQEDETTARDSNCIAIIARQQNTSKIQN